MVRPGAPWTCSVWASALRTGAGAGAEAPKAVGRMIAIATRAIAPRALSGKRSGSRFTTARFASRRSTPPAGAEPQRVALCEIRVWDGFRTARGADLDGRAVRGQGHVDVAPRRVRVRA